MNSIAEKQNDELQIARLAAQRVAYSRAKVVLGLQMILAGPVAITAALLAMLFPAISVYTALWSGFVALTDVLFLSRAQRKLCENGARIQERFDCEVLELPWNKLKLGDYPDPELVGRYSKAYDASKMPTLRDWYSVNLRPLPLRVARLACQRSNCWWDADQRRAYSHLISIALFATGAIILFLGAVMGLSVELFLKAVLLPIIPAVVLSIRQIFENADAMSRAERLKSCAASLWHEALAGKSSRELEVSSRQLQDEIFEHRKRSPLIFDFAFKHIRDRYEAEMNYSSDQLAAEASTALAAGPTGGKTGN